MFVMNKLFEWNIGSSVLSDINDHFLLMNDVGLSFGMLSLVKVIYKNLDWMILSVDPTWSSSKV